MSRVARPKKKPWAGWSHAVLPMGQLLREDGYAAELRKRGYTVEAPGEESAIDASAIP